MAFRDELEAALARIAALERDLEKARAAEVRAMELEAALQIARHEAERDELDANQRLHVETAQLRAELDSERARVKALEEVVAAQEELIRALREASS